MIKYQLLTILLCLGVASSALADSWHDLQQHLLAEDHAEVVPVEAKPQADPWAKLLALYLPFSQQDARQNPAKVRGYLHQTLKPFQADIDTAATLFAIPEEIINAVIIVESSGNPRAKAQTSTAKGLMQTIDSTFSLARKGLAKQGVDIENNPYNPRSSILAGSWYLNEMFKQAVLDGLVTRGQRSTLQGWRIPVEYYYAGPGHGRKPQPIVLIYTGGKRVVVDKAKYSNKVMGWLGG